MNRVVSKLLHEAIGYVWRTNRVVSFFAATTLCFAGEPTTVGIVEKIDQYSYTKSINACGPTCMLMQFQSGTPQMQAAYAKLLGDNSAKKLNYAVDRFFKNKRSTLSTTFDRWSGTGVFVADLTASAQDWLEESGQDRDRISGGWLDRKTGEKDSDFIRRIHERIQESIESKVPPILNLRSFVAREKAREPGRFQWRPGRQHFVIVSAIQSDLVDGNQAAKLVSSPGFWVTVVDPVGGMESNIFIFNEPHQQDFMAMKGNEMKGEWLSGRPFLEVSAPVIAAMRPAKLKWNERVVVIANYLIGAN